MERYAIWLARHRAAVAAALAIAVAASAWALPRLSLAFSASALFVTNERAARDASALEAQFDTPDVLAVVTLAWPAPIGPAELSAIGRVGDAVRRVPGVGRVIDLATVEVAESSAGLPRSVRFADIAAPDVIAAAARHPLLVGSVLARDGRSAALVVVLPDDHDDPDGQADGQAGGRDHAARLDAVEAAARAAAPADATVRLVGTKVIDRAMSRVMQRDALVSGALQTLCCLLVLALLFRTVRGVVIPLAVVLTSLLLFLGAQVALGASLSLIEVTVPGLILIIGLCDAIHMVHRFEEARARGLDRGAAVRETLAKVGVACLFTSVTTAIGFLSLLVAEHAAVRDFAVTASLGIGIAFVVAMTATPLLLSVWPVRETGPRPVSGGRWLRGWRAPRVAAVIAAVTIAVVGLSVLGIARTSVDSRWLEELPDDHPVTRAHRWYETRFDGLVQLDVYLSGPMDDPAVVRAVRALERDIEAEPGVTGVICYTDWIGELLAAGRPEPELTDAAIARGVAMLRLAGDGFPGHVLDADMRRARMRVRLQDVGTRQYGRTMAAIERHVERRLTGPSAASAGATGVTGVTGGTGRLAVESSQLLVTTTLDSLLVSLAVVGLVMVLLFRSARVGLISLVPTAIPVVIALGLTGWLGIPLRLGIVMIFSLGVGLAVDNSIHLVARYRHERRARPDAAVDELLATSVATSGRPLAISAAVLALGAMSYLPASFRSIRDTGVLLTTIVIAALLASLYVLPRLLARWPERRRLP